MHGADSVKLNHLLKCSKLLSSLVRSLITVRKKVFSQSPIVQVLALEKMREACN